MPTYDATVLARLKQAGAVMLGKTVTTEFAFRNPSETRNPWNLEHTPGGSSAGSGAAVADRMCLAALGSQTAGSVLRPAVFNGVVGFKPTYGRISLEGVVPLSWEMDHVGCMARAVEDAHLLWHLMRLEGTLDWQSTREKLPPSLLPRAPRTVWRIRDAFEAESSPEALVNLEKACLRLEQSGARIVEKPLPPGFHRVDEVHQTILAAEAAAYHSSRFAERRHLYSFHLSDLVREGQAIRGTDYIAARRERERLRREIAGELSEVEVAITPGSVTPAPELMLNTTGDARFQRPWSLLGIPTLAVPTGLTAERLPMGVQLVAAPDEEEVLFQVGGWCESLFRFNLMPA